MAFDPHGNFAYSTVATAPSPASSGTSLTLATGDGALFPAPGAQGYNCTVWLASTAEIVRVTAKVGDVLTITRAQEGSTARAILVGDQIANTITAKVIADVETAASPAGTGTEVQYRDGAAFGAAPGSGWELVFPGVLTVGEQLLTSGFGDHATQAFTRANGPHGAETATLDGDELGKQNWAGYLGPGPGATFYRNAVTMRAVQDGTVATLVPGKLFISISHETLGTYDWVFSKLGVLLTPGPIAIGDANVSGDPIGVQLSAVDGVLTMLGQGAGAAENLIWDFDTVANTVGVSSSTGVTRLAFGVIGLVAAVVVIPDGPVSALPSAAANKGARATVNDATTSLAAGIGTAVVGGGAIVVPVFSNGGAWLIG